MKDGNYDIYQIQHWVKKSYFSLPRSQWHGSNFDHFGTPHVTGPGATKEYPWASKNGFSACGNCWQQTGIHGTFDEKAGLEGLRFISKKHPTYKFRLIKVSYRQSSVEIEVRGPVKPRNKSWINTR